jgi:hypothetical protein
LDASGNKIASEAFGFFALSYLAVGLAIESCWLGKEEFTSLNYTEDDERWAT